MRPWALVALLALACDGPAETDAGAPAPDAATPFEEPTPPAPPEFTPCPDGWAAVDSGEGFEVCEPPGGDACPAGTFRFVDDAECVPVGDCASGEWPDAPAGRPAVYVRAGASGDGTMGAPYGSIAEAIPAAPPGAAILVARGTYPEALDVYGGLAVIGACADETVIAPASGFAAVRAAELGVHVENVAIRPAGPVGGVEVTGELTLRSVIIEGAADDAILVQDGGALDAEALVVRDTVNTMPLFGRGLAVAEGSATVARGIFERCPGAAVLASVGARVTLRAVAARESGQEILGAPQLIAQGDGCELEVLDSVLEDTTGSGLFVNVGAQARAEQVVMRGLEVPEGESSSAPGVFVRERGGFEGARLRVVGAKLMGLGFVEDARVSIEDVFVDGVADRPLDGQPVGMGILYSGPELVARRVAVRDAAHVGVQIESAGGELLFEDLSIARSGEGPGGEYQPMGFAQLEGSATLRRARVSESRGVGVYSARSTLTLEDVAIVETPGVADGRFGRGIDLVEGSGVFSRVLVRGAREIAIHAFRRAEVDLRDVRLIDTRGRDCQATTCPDEPGGLGLAAISATIRAEAFEVDGARLCGAMVAGPAASLDLSDGAIGGASVGACVQVEGYDLERLTDGVEYRDNDINLEATSHATPAPSDPLGSIEL